MESWEALELDDSDLPSLRPLKRQSQSVLKPHYTHSQSSTVSSRNLSPLSPCPQHYKPSTHPRLPGPASTSRGLIPGPAGEIQAAMHRRDADRVDSFGDKEIQISTQEYLRRVERDEGKDFGRNPWLLALKLASCQGMVERTPLKAVKKCANGNKIDKVVAIIKSCNADYLGGMMVTLKDPTDTIGASIHGKVLTDGRFGRDLVVGSVMILQKILLSLLISCEPVTSLPSPLRASGLMPVSVFTPSGASVYLNIVLRNVVKVISSELGSFELPASAVKHFAHDSSRKIDKPAQGPIMITEGVTEEAGQDGTRSGHALTEKLMEEESSVARSCFVGSRMNQLATILDAREGKQFEKYNIPEAEIQTDPVNSFVEASGDDNINLRAGDSSPSIQSNRRRCNPNIACKLDDLENFEPEAVKNKNQARKEDNDLGSLIEVQPTKAMNMPTQPSGNKFTLSNIKLDEEVAPGSTGVGKHGRPLIFYDSFKQWTDEELGILDMDED